MNKFQILDEGLFIRKISKSIRNKPIIRDISLNLKKGEIVGLLGPNGAGKTTTFYIIVGLIKPDTGSIYIDKKKHLQQFLKDSLKKMQKEEYIGDLIVNNI